MSLTFKQLAAVNAERCEAVFHPIESWSASDWGVAFAGEAGEACDFIKKLKRHESGTNTAKDPATRAALIEAIGKELADTVCYADLLATRLGIDLGEAVRAKFNEVSELRGASQRL